MSRFVSVPLTVRNAAELHHALGSLRLEPECAQGFELAAGIDAGPTAPMVMLEGSLECAGEPVHLRFAAGTLGTVEDFGLRLEAEGPVLVCGEYDTALLERELLGPFVAAIAQRRLALAGQHGQVVRETDGTIRIVVDES